MYRNRMIATSFVGFVSGAVFLGLLGANWFNNSPCRNGQCSTRPAFAQTVKSVAPVLEAGAPTAQSPVIKRVEQPETLIQKIKKPAGGTINHAASCPQCKSSATEGKQRMRFGRRGRR